MRTILDSFRDYLLLEKKYSSHTVLAYIKDVESFVSFLPDDITLEKVIYADIRAWIVSMSTNDFSVITINRKISSLKALYKFLLKIKLIEVNPLSKHIPLKSTKTLQIPFSQSETNTMLNIDCFKDDFEGVRDRLIIELFYSTGMRRAELISLKLSDIDFSSSILKVLGKRNKERLIPLMDKVIVSLMNYIKLRSELINSNDCDFLFLNKSGLKVSESLVYRVVNRYFSIVSEKVKKSPHILRHSFATHMIEKGADINSVKELLGHSSLASTQIYVNMNLSEMKSIYSESHPRGKKR